MKLATYKAYDGLNRLTSIVSSNALNGVMQGETNMYNFAHQRIQVTLHDGSFWLYQYDALGQVTSGVKHWPNGTPYGGQSFKYNVYDQIGNRRRTMKENRVSQYKANSLNQYEYRTVPGALDITGSADENAKVTVNYAPALRLDDYFWKELPVNNKTGAVYQSVLTLAAITNTVATNQGDIFLPPSVEYYTYDDDGNLLTDGRWRYTWDGENQLKNMESHTNGPPASKRKLEFEYDSMGRRIQKQVSTWSTNTSTYAVTKRTRFLYDGWNLVAELDAWDIYSPAAPVRTYLWGSDLSGTLQGAGGVGGLLAVTDATYENFTAYDSNGNLLALVNANTGNVSARNAYGPFGERIRDEMLNFYALCPFGFSSKYTDDETEMVYYGYRYYNPSTGRWVTRDPIEERGGFNLMAFVHNDTLGYIDYLGFDERKVGDYIITGEGQHRIPVEVMQKNNFHGSLAREIDKNKDLTVPTAHDHGGAGHPHYNTLVKDEMKSKIRDWKKRGIDVTKPLSEKE